MTIANDVVADPETDVLHRSALTLVYRAPRAKSLEGTHQPWQWLQAELGPSHPKEDIIKQPLSTCNNLPYLRFITDSEEQRERVHLYMSVWGHMCVCVCK